MDKVPVIVLQRDWKDRAKAQLRRNLYPLKESTLTKLRELSRLLPFFFLNRTRYATLVSPRHLYQESCLFHAPRYHKVAY